MQKSAENVAIGRQACISLPYICPKLRAHIKMSNHLARINNSTQQAKR